MKFLLITFLLYCQRNFIILFPKRLNTYLYANISSGNDERYETHQIKETYLNNLRQNFEKKRLLEILQDNNVSINTKIELLKDNSVKASNLKAGGLFNEFDFNFY
jgi:hypothetical protein